MSKLFVFSNLLFFLGVNVFCLSFFAVQPVHSQDSFSATFNIDNVANNQTKIKIHFFYSATCFHCADEKKFLEKLEKKIPKIDVKKYEISKNIDLVKKFYQEYKIPPNEQGLVPITFIEKQYFLGFSEATGKNIEEYISGLVKGISLEKNFPIFGKIDVEKFSFPVLTMIFGFFDGFNICSLGSLILILSLTLVLKSRKRILILGGIFLMTTAVIYGILIFFWHQVFENLSFYAKKLEIAIGIMAIAGSGWFFYQFLKNRKKQLVCESKNGLSEKINHKVQKIFAEKTNILILILTVFLFAGIITVVEFPCSAVLPVLFAGILYNAHLPTFLFFFYIVLYILFYLLDEIIVFLLAVFTMKIWLGSSKFLNFLNLLTAFLLLFLGVFYLFGLG